MIWRFKNYLSTLFLITTATAFCYDYYGPYSQNKIQVLGGVINNWGEAPLGQSCIEVRKAPFSSGSIRDNTLNVEYIPNRAAQVEVSFFSDYQKLKWEVQNTFQLGITDFNGPGSSFSISPIQFLHESEESSTNFIFTFKAAYKGGKLILKSPYKLNKDIRKDYPDFADFSTICGERFVNQLILGAEAYVTINIEVFKKNIKNEISNSLPLNSIFKLGNLNEIMGKLYLKTQKDNLQIRINILGIQKGGNAANIGGILGSGITTCNSSNFLSCISMVSNIAEYFNKDNSLGFAFDLKDFIVSDETEVVRLPMIANVLSYDSMDYCCMTPQERPLWCPENSCSLTENSDLELSKINANYNKFKLELDKIYKFKKDLKIPLHESYQLILKKYENVLLHNLEILDITKNKCFQTPYRCQAFIEDTSKNLSPLNPEIWNMFERENKVKICFETGAQNDLSKIEVKILEKGVELDKFTINEAPKRLNNECFLFHSPLLAEKEVDEIMIRAWSKLEENEKCRLHSKNKFSNWLDWDLLGIKMELLNSNKTLIFNNENKIKIRNKCKTQDSPLESSIWQSIKTKPNTI